MNVGNTDYDNTDYDNTMTILTMTILTRPGRTRLKKQYDSEHINYYFRTA